MTFNQGFLCPDCGPIPTAKKRSIAKVQHDTCPDCGKIVSKWERPLNERSGRCNNCGGGAFTLVMWKGDLLRKCKKCDEVYNTDTKIVKRKGLKKYEYKPSK
jgi:hypothetical protein